MGRRRGPALDRAQVIAAAVRCVEAEGPSALGVSRVARELGIRPPSLYNHIDKGDDLAWAVAIEGHRRFLSALSAPAPAGAPPEEQLWQIMSSGRAWALSNRHLYAAMSQTPPDNAHPDFAPLLERTLALFRGPLLELGLAEAEMVHVIRGLRAAAHGFVLLESGQQFQLSEAADESFERMIRALIRGLVA